MRRVACEQSEKRSQRWKDIPSHNLRHETLRRPKEGIWAIYQHDSSGGRGFDIEEGIKRMGIWSFCINQASNLVSWRVVRTRLSYERPRAQVRTISSAPKARPLADGSQRPWLALMPRHVASIGATPRSRIHLSLMKWGVWPVARRPIMRQLLEEDKAEKRLNFRPERISNFAAFTLLA
jgi:hypothetical protein